MSDSRHLIAPASNKIAVPSRGNYLPATSDRLDLSGSISFFQRRFKLIVIVICLSVMAGLAISLLSEKTYTAKATVMLTNEANAAVRNPGTSDGRAIISSELVDTQVEIITSREMVERVAKANGLDKGLTAGQRRALITDMRENLSAERAGKSFALAIMFEAPDGQLAAETVNEFAKQYSEWELLDDQERNTQARKLIQSRLVELRTQANADTKQLQQYRIANNLLSTSGTSLTEQEISTYNQEVTRARAEAAEADARLRTALAQLRSGSNGDDVGEALGSSVISSLRLQEAQNAAEVANLGARYGANHPQLIRAQSQLGEVKSQIQAEINRVISNLRAKRDVSAQRLGSLTGSLAIARGKLSQNNAAMVGLSELERSAEASKGIYESYLSRYKELLAAEGSERPNARILTLANAPTLPTSPNLPLNLALSLAIGLGLGILAAYVVESIFHGITTPDEIEGGLGERYLASIPLLKSVETKIPHAVSAIQQSPHSAFAESFRTLGTSIEQAFVGDEQVIAITSALPDEGKTVTSCCLSYVLAQSGKRTMLIDCDTRRSGISRLLDMQSHENSLTEILNGTKKLNLDRLDDDRIFCVLPLNPSDIDSDHLLMGPAFTNLLEQLRTRFDRIILDLPPILPIASTPVLASRADVVVVMAHWRKTSIHALRTALKRMPPDKVNLVGVALNQVDLRRKAFFDREDPAFYYKKYSEYYS